MPIGKITCRSKYIEWILSDFYSLLDERVVMRSPDFDFAGGSWQLAIFNPIEEDDSEWISVKLLNLDELAVRFSGRIGVKRDDGTVYISHRFGQHNFNVSLNMKIQHFVQRSTLWADMPAIAPRGDVMFFCWVGSFEGKCEETNTHIGEIEGIEKLSQDFKEMYIDGKDSDTTIKIAGREFKAHRLILGARSPVFAAMYSHDTTERSTGIVEIEDCDPEIFQHFLIFLYSGKVETISSENVLRLYAIADKYDVKEVKQKCLKFMMSNFSVENFCEFIILALKYSESELLKSASDFFVKNVKQISVTSEWLCFHRDYPVESNDLCSKAFQLYAPD